MLWNLILVALTHSVSLVVVSTILGFISPNNITRYYLYAAKLLLTFLISAFTFEVLKIWYLRNKIEPSKKAVLITGCDRGFGHYLAKRLDSRGFQVFASCLFPKGEGAVELKNTSSKRLHVLELDVTSDDSVKKALIYVKENLGTSVLWAIVNNAGVYKGNNAELSSMEDYKDTMEVNAFGPVRVTKAFLPLLRCSRGRVINLTSMAGKLASPHLTPYTMSKHAAQAFSDCLAQEMKAWGIKVISVQPEFFKTPMTNPKTIEKQMLKEFQRLPPKIREDYGEFYLEDLRRRVTSIFKFSSPKINTVIDALESAIILKHPGRSYACYRNAIFAVAFYIVLNVPTSFSNFLIEICYTLLHGRLRRPKSLIKLLT